MKCAIYYVNEWKNNGIDNEEKTLECKSLGIARNYLNSLSYLTKDKFKIKRYNSISYFEIRYKFTDVGYDTTNEKWYIK